MWQQPSVLWTEGASFFTQAGGVYTGGMEIIPSILARSDDEFAQLVRRYEPYAHRVQLDVTDATLTAGRTIVGYEELARARTELAFDVHLMLLRPAAVLANWCATPAERLIIHAEAEGDLGALLRDIRSCGKRGALALNPETPVSRIEPHLEHCDFVQFMTVHPGSYGAGFLPEVVQRIADFHRAHPEVVIAVDGGIVPATAKLVTDAGATLLVVGSFLKDAADIPAALRELTPA